MRYQGLVTKNKEGLGLKNWRVGHVKVPPPPPPKKKGAEKVLAMLKGGGGHNMFWGSFYAVDWSFSHMEGWCTKFPCFIKRGARTVFLCLEGGGGAGRNRFQTSDFPILESPPPPDN